MNVANFTLDSFREMVNRTKKLGPLRKTIERIPGMGELSTLMGDADHDAEIARIGGIIDAMTPEERRRPAQLINRGRRLRIAIGSGVTPSEVAELLRQFTGMAKVLEKIQWIGRSDLGKLGNGSEGLGFGG